METLTQNFRLDSHELQIKQLHTAVTEIKSTLKLLEEYRSESVEFRKVFLDWMQKQEQRIDDGSSGSGFTGHVFSASTSNLELAESGLPISDSATSVHEISALTSISSSLFPDSSLDPNIGCAVVHSSGSPPQSPSLLAQLEAIISRSDERLRSIDIRKKPNVDGSSGSGSGFSSKVFSGSDSKSITPTPSILDSAESEHEVSTLQSISQSFLQDLSLDLEIAYVVDRSSGSLPILPSLPAGMTTIIPNYEANSIGAGKNLPRFDKQPAVQAKLGLLGDKWAMLDTLWWALGSGIGMGLDVELQIVVGRYSPDLGPFYGDFQFVTQVAFSSFASKLFVLDEDPKPPDPDTNLKSDLLWKLFHGWCKTASQVAAGVVGSFHLWMVHGQCRPPENAFGEASAWLSSQLFVTSLEGKTVLKGGVMIGIVL